MKVAQVLAEGKHPLPKSVIKAFEKLGDDQRGKPEAAMNDVQEAAGGGVLSHVVEHVGDLTHRMSHMVGWSGGSAGYEYVKDKVAKTLRPLTQAFGFEKEMEINFENNAKYRKVPVEELEKKTKAELKKYAAEHAKLVVYNRAQWLAREAAVALGEQQWWIAIKHLRELNEMLKTQRSWDSHALSYRLDEKGEPIPYKP